MSKRSTRIWLGIGTSILLGTTAAGSAGTSATDTESLSDTDASMVAAGGEAGEAGEGGEAGHGGEGGEGGEGGGAMSVFSNGGEGGEGGEGGPSALESPGVYYSQLAFMLGHMRVAQELFEAGQGKIGRTHLGHPADEHLPAVREALEKRGFHSVIEQIESLASSGGVNPDWPAVQGAYEKARGAILDAMSDVADDERNDPEFIADVLTAILYQARDEYGEAIEDGTFALAHEYQDSMGFILIGRELLDWKKDVLQLTDASAYEELVAKYEAVMEAWPSPQPPAKPVLSVSELYGRIAATELVLSHFAS